MEKEILTLEQAGLLFQVSTKTLLKLLREEKVPARKIGREWRFSRQALIDWVAAGDSQKYSLSDAEVKGYFNQVAPQWEKMRQDYFGEAVRDKLFKQVQVPARAVVADLGAGSGYLAEALAGRAKQVVAVDVSEEMLGAAQARLASAGITNVVFKDGDAQDLPLADASLDMAFANMLLHHVAEPPLVLAEMARVLKPGGQLVITDLDEHQNEWMREEMSDVWLGFDRAELRRWMEEAGFRDVRVDCLGCDCCGTSGGGEEAKVSIFLATGIKNDQRQECGKDAGMVPIDQGIATGGLGPGTVPRTPQGGS
ncbi:MAG: helix-turn-helix domain-containing protein [Actinobacteria bacterium]|nr:helix-turn-helix domain-containing protein [Actinomycetota bacterium]